MNKVIIALLGILLIAGCTNRDIVIPDSGSPQLITTLNVQVDSVEDAKETLSNWLNSETNFGSNSNKIEFVDEYDDYFNLRLTTAITINDRESGIIGYRDYKLNKDGTLFGYHYSK